MTRAIEIWNPLNWYMMYWNTLGKQCNLYENYESQNYRIPIKENDIILKFLQNEDDVMDDFEEEEPMLDLAGLQKLGGQGKVNLTIKQQS